MQFVAQDADVVRLDICLIFHVVHHGICRFPTCTDTSTSALIVVVGFSAGSGRSAGQLCKRATHVFLTCAEIHSDFSRVSLMVHPPPWKHRIH